MAIPPTIKLSPAFESKMTEECRILSQRYNQGHEERARDGQNNIVKSWDVSAIGITDAVANDLDDKLSRYRGVTAFYWHPENRLTNETYVCEEWQRDYLGPNANNFSARFQQTFRPGA